MPNWIKAANRRKARTAGKNVTLVKPLKIGKYVKPPRPKSRLVKIPGQPSMLVQPVPGRVVKKTVITRRVLRRKQGGRGLADVAKAIASNPNAQEIGKRALAKGIGYLPKLFKKGTNKIENKHLRKIAQSDIALDMVSRGTKRLLRESEGLVGGL